MNAKDAAIRPSTETLKDQWGILTYRGVLRDGKRVVWRCECKGGHEARRFSYSTLSAWSCAARELRRRQEEGT